MRTLSILLALAGLGFSTTALAQSHIEFGPRIGANLTSALFNSTEISSPELSYSSSRGYLAGYQLGVGASLNYGHWAVQPALLFSQKGEKQVVKASSDFFGMAITQDFHADTRVNYLELPVNLVYALGENGQGLQVFAGPYLAVGVGGKAKYEERATLTDPNGTVTKETSGTERMAFGSRFAEPDPNSPDEPHDVRIRRLDAGLNLGLGYRCGPVQVQATYALGLKNVQPSYPESYQLSDDTGYNRSFQLTATYFLPKASK